MDRFDEELRARLSDAAGEITDEAERAPARGAAPLTARWRPRGAGHMIGIAAAITALVIAAVQLLPAGDEQGSLIGPDTGISAEPTIIATPHASSSPGEAPSPEDGDGPDPSPIQDDYPPAPSPTETERPLLASCPVPDTTPPPRDVSVTVAADKRVVARGSEITFTVRVRNNGLKPVTYTRGGQEFDFWVREIRYFDAYWLWSRQQYFTDPFITETLAPGEERTAVETWDLTTCGDEERDGEGPPPAMHKGSYEVRGAWVSDSGGGEWWSPPVAFEIS